MHDVILYALTGSGATPPAPNTGQVPAHDCRLQFPLTQKRLPIVQALPIDIVRAQKRQIERLLLVNEFALGYFGLDPIR